MKGIQDYLGERSSYLNLSFASLFVGKIETFDAGYARLRVNSAPFQALAIAMRPEKGARDLSPILTIASSFVIRCTRFSKNKLLQKSDHKIFFL